MSFTLNLRTIEQSKINVSQDRDLLPEGSYAAKISGCEHKVSQAGHPFFAFEFTIEPQVEYPDCPFVGRRLWNNLMISHPNEQVTAISQRTLADILIACGLSNDTQIDDLEMDFPLLTIDKSLYIRVYHKMDKVKHELRPEIAAYFGRGEFEGIHRYMEPIKGPLATEAITGSPQVCQKATALRDTKLAKAQAPLTPTSQHPMSDIQRERTLAALTSHTSPASFEDVPF
jgi:hypothetical protein